RPGLRLPGSWDGFEIAVRAVLGQQVSVAAARTLATRLVQRHGIVLAQAPLPGLDRLFPTPEALADADLRELGVTGARAETIRGMARALLDGRVDFRAEQSLDEFVARWVALPGIGEWTAHYMAMRALSHPDAFPAADLILRRAAARGGAARKTQGSRRMSAPETIWYDELPTPIGRLRLVADAHGLREVWFESGRHQKMPAPHWKHDAGKLAFARVQLEEYFAGTRQTFALPLHPLGTPFQLAVWQELAHIPYGATTSYGEP